MIRYGEGMAQGVLGGSLGPGNLSPSYAPIVDTEAFRDARLGLAAKTRPPKRRSSPEDLKRAERLGDELAARYGHPLALAAAEGLTVFEAPAPCLNTMSPADPGKETIGLASLSVGEIFVSRSLSHRSQLAAIVHEIAHFLEREGDEEWCEAFAGAFVLACAGQCYMGDLAALGIERGETTPLGKWMVTHVLPSLKRPRRKAA